jgi:hypothetical protein
VASFSSPTVPHLLLAVVHGTLIRRFSQTVGSLCAFSLLLVSSTTPSPSCHLFILLLLPTAHRTKSMEQPTTYYAFLCQIIPSRMCYTVLVSPRLQKVWHRVPCTGDKNIPMMKALEIKSCSSVLISTGFFRL